MKQRGWLKFNWTAVTDDVANNGAQRVAPIYSRQVSTELISEMIRYKIEGLDKAIRASILLDRFMTAVFFIK